MQFKTLQLKNSSLENVSKEKLAIEGLNPLPLQTWQGDKPIKMLKCCSKPTLRIMRIMDYWVSMFPIYRKTSMSNDHAKKTFLGSSVVFHSCIA